MESLLFAIFSFAKIFEGIVTVWGEDLGTLEEEKSYYNLVYDAIELQQEIFDYLISKYDNIKTDRLDWIIQLYLCEGNPEGKNEKMKNMLIKMKASLDEEVGSLKKNKVDENGKFIRQYPIWD